MRRNSKEDEFKDALKGKKIPILTLDNNWYRLFSQNEPTPEIKALEGKLNDLLRKQGKLNTDVKGIKAIKKKLMDEIVSTMDEIGDKEPSKKAQKKLDENKRLIEECNEKLESYEDELHELPYEINDTNCELMIKTMEICYETIQENNEDIEEISKWVEEIRIELKKRLVRKQQKIQRNQNYYNYMHNLFGAEVIDIFDMKYNVKPFYETNKTGEKTEKNNEENKGE